MAENLVDLANRLATALQRRGELLAAWERAVARVKSRRVLYRRLGGQNLYRPRRQFGVV